jgi:hypothetical protein
LTVGPTLTANNSVLDVGPPKPMHGDRGEF